MSCSCSLIGEAIVSQNKEWVSARCSVMFDTASPWSMNASRSGNVPHTPPHSADFQTAVRRPITATPTGTDLGGTTTKLQTAINALNVPDGVSVRIGGVSEQQQESFAQLGLAMLPMIILGLGSGFVMDRVKAKRRLLPLAHGAVNALLVLLALCQLYTGIAIIRDMLLA